MRQMNEKGCSKKGDAAPGETSCRGYFLCRASLGEFGLKLADALIRIDDELGLLLK